MANNQIPKWQQQMRAQKEAEAAAAAKKKKTRNLILILVCAAVLIAAVVAAILLLPKTTATSGTTPATEPTLESHLPSTDEPTVDMNAVKAAINSKQVSDFTDADKPTNYVKLTVEGYGEIVICLCPETAPITVDNFKTLVGSSFYDGLTFHRVYPGFMIQGGDPDGNGGGGSGTNIKGEFASNGVQNDLSHVRGVISMARATPPDSASSQFFICHADSDFLDTNYAAFGYVVAGMNTVDAICEVELIYNDDGELSSPVTPVVITSAVFVTSNE